jgi:hypothetical protein
MKPRVAALVSCAILSTWASAATADVLQQCLAANDSAQDLRKAGKLHAAREKLALCLAASCPGPVRADCSERLTEIGRAMPSVVLDVKDAGGNDVSAVRVTLDGEKIADRVNGAAIEVDPGEHRFVFVAEGAPSVEKIVIAKEGDKERRVDVVVAQGASAQSMGRTSTSAWLVGPLVVAGIGVAALIGSGVMYAVSASDASTVENTDGCVLMGGAYHCNASASAMSTASQGQSLYTASLVALGVGAGLVVLGGVWMLVARPHSSPGKQMAFILGPTPGGAMFGVGGSL